MTTDAPSTTPSVPPRNSYWRLSTQPLYVLLFLAPLITLYEIGSAIFLTDAKTGQVSETIRAYALFSHFFELFGVGGAFLPGVALIVVLLVWQALAKLSWRVRPAVLGLMAVESAAWALPILVLAQASERFSLAQASAPTGQSLGAGATIAIGAGLYEELLFRMVAIAAAHFVLVDLFSVKETPGRIAAITLAALTFALYHHNWPENFAFYTAAGMYLGGLYVYRGFGVVVATHAIYDLALLL